MPAPAARQAGRARAHPGSRQVHGQTARPGRHRLPSRPRRPRGPRLRGAGRGLRAGAGVAGRVRGGDGLRGGGEPVGAGLVGDHLRDTEADQLVQGVGDRAGRPGEYLADLVRGEGRLRELAQVLLDQVAQRAGPGRGGAPAAGGGLDRPPALGGQVAGGVQGGEGDVQVPGREGLAGLVGGLGDGRDGPGGLGGDRRVRPRRGAGFRLLAPGGAASRGPGRAGRRRPCRRQARRRAARRRRCPRRGSRRAGPLTRGSGAAGVQVSAMPGRLPLTRVAVPFFSCASRACRAAAVLIPARAAITATVAPAGSADSAARTAAAGLSPAAGATGAGAGSSRCRRRCGPRAGRGGCWCVP